MVRNTLSVVIILIFLSSCSLINKIALRTTADVIKSGSDESMTEGNWSNFKQATPANLKLLEGLWFADQKNKTLLTLLIKGHSAYAFAISETEALPGILLDEPNEELVNQTILYYEKAIYYGEKYLALSGIESSEFWNAAFPSKLAPVFENKFDSDDYVALLYLGQAIGSSINLQRDNIVKMSYMNHAFKTIEWVCAKDPELEFGSCGLFSAVLTASVPSILGGSQTKAKAQFQQMMIKMPYNLLVHLSFIQYHLIPMMEEDEFKQEIKKLSKKLDSWYALQKGIRKESNQIYQKHREANLYNAIAKKRFKLIKNIEKELF